MLTAYPKVLTDPAWKKVEKAAGVSATGVGKTLRDAEKAWQTLAGELASLEKGQVPPAKADASKKAMIAAFNQSETLLTGLLPKIKKPDKNVIIKDHAKVIENLIRDLRNSFNLVDDHRGIDFVVDKFNAHVKADVSAFKHKV
jgi:hypothetical protein